MVVQTEIALEGLDEVLDLLRRGDVNAAKALARSMRASTELLRDRMAKYPPPPPDSSYRRTGTLARKWEAGARISGFAGEVMGFARNKETPYASYVQGFVEQARVHQGRWQTEREVLEKSEDEIMEIFEAEIAALFDE